MESLSYQYIKIFNFTIPGISRNNLALWKKKTTGKSNRQHAAFVLNLQIRLSTTANETLERSMKARNHTKCKFLNKVMISRFIMINERGRRGDFFTDVDIKPLEIHLLNGIIICTNID
jgi:hypothetical protein